jgi:Arc/MetJ-type ribon-helix-helix transcriptional regulator
MPTTSITVRLDDELLADVDAREGSRSDVVKAALERGLKVPEGLETLILSTSQIASLDQTAQRWGLTRIEAMQRILKERILREFTEERQRQLDKRAKLTSV